MKNISGNIIKEDQIINGGLLALSIAIVITGISSESEGLELLPVAMCSIAIPPLAFNAFIIEYRKRYNKTVKHWSYDLMVYIGMLLTCCGLVTALYLKSTWLAGTFFLGVVVCLPSFLYLKELDKANIKKDWQ